MELKERIVESSIRLFLQRGCKSVTMDDIVAEIGISKRTLYEIFEDKNSLLIECLEKVYSRTKTITDNIFATENNVYEIIFRTHECQSDSGYHLRLTFLTELKKYYPEVYEQLMAKFSKYHDENTIKFISRGQAEGLIMEHLDISIVSRTLIAISNMVIRGDTYDNVNATRIEIFKHTILLYIRGI
jgi:AcrR family transcriptional regulator